MSREERTVQLADGHGTAEVMQGDRCVYVAIDPRDAPLILEPDQARRLGERLALAAAASERHAAPKSDEIPDNPANVATERPAPREDTR